MVDNFNLIKPLLDFKNPGDFYFIQILKRRKDNPEMERDMTVINNYFIDSIEDLDRQSGRIVHECSVHNARAYIRVNVRNYKDLGLVTMKKITEYMISNDYKAIRNAWLSAAGEHHSQDRKRWIVDIDVKYEDAVEKVCNRISKVQEGKNNILQIIPTKNGYHVITHPFNLLQFRENQKASDLAVDIHKDNPTILFIP